MDRREREGGGGTGGREGWWGGCTTDRFDEVSLLDNTETLTREKDK